MRWRQDSETGKFVPIDEQAVRKDGGVAIHGPLMEPFVSPIDGSVITGRKSLREHCQRHGVVPAQEFTPEFYEQKAKERQDFFERKRSPAQVQQDRMQIYENWMRLERESGR